MRRALGAVLFWLAIWLLAGCAYKLRKSDNRWDKEAETTKWETAAEKHDEQKHETARDEQRKVTGKARARVKKPDGTTIDLDLDWVDEAVAKYTARAVSASDSRSTAGGETKRAKDAGSNVNVNAGAKAGWPSPLWLLLIIPAVALVWWLRRRWPPRIPFW